MADCWLPWQPQNVVTTLQCLTWNGKSLDHATCTLLRRRRKWKYSPEQVQGQDLCKDHASPPLWECFAGHLEFEHNPSVWKTYTWNNLQEIHLIGIHTQVNNKAIRGFTNHRILYMVYVCHGQSPEAVTLFSLTIPDSSAHKPSTLQPHNLIILDTKILQSHKCCWLTLTPTQL